MRIDVFFSPGELAEVALEEHAVVVIDVVRATTTIVEALANGARGIFPTTSAEEAVKLASSLGRGDALLCGERKGLKVEGFQLGNSPSEFSAEAVAGKQLVMTTSNGTTALRAAEDAEQVLCAAFVNLSAVVEALGAASDLVLLCAGREKRLALEDAVCAGMILQALTAGTEETIRLNDGARVALGLADRYSVSTEFLLSTDAGKSLAAIGLESDLEVCATVDRRELVPVMRERQIRILDG